MIISPPFLPVGAGDTVDVDAVMRGDGPGNGGFPVSFELAWHGGIHLDAPGDGNSSIPVRAIADGVIKYAGKCDTNIVEGSPLYYYAGETSNGVVVIEHITEIGEDVEVVFYSIYMHLSELKAGVAVGKKIYRKDELGTAGLIYGQPNKIHLEIVCDDANLQKLVGRSSAKLDISKDGRTDALWGEMYFAVPAGTVFYSTNLGDAKIATDKAAKLAASARNKAATAMAKANAAPSDRHLSQLAQAAQIGAQTAQHKASEAALRLAASPLGTTDMPLFLGMRYNKGTCTLTSYREDGTELGSIADASYEYELYNQATELYPECPSAGFELLRFGRVIGPDALQPADAAHWRKIVTHSGEGWIDLRPDTIKKFSDADFPHWRGWLLVDDDTNGDSRCDSALIKKIIVPDNTAQTSAIDYHAGLTDAEVQKSLQRTICKTPSSWSNVNINGRWGWLKSSDERQQSPSLNGPMDDESFEKLKAHLQAQMFWSKAGLPEIAYWHFNPREFIRTFRQCGWLSKIELARCIPKKYKTEKKAKGSGIITATVSTAIALERVSARSNAKISSVCRKYLIDARLRQAHFFSQVFRETGALHWSQELATGADYEDRLDLGNIQDGDGVRFKGRGLIQTTGRHNYASYSKYHGRASNAFTIEPNNLLLANDAYFSADAAGYFWTTNNINAKADSGYAEPNVRAITRTVNGSEDGQWTGLVERKSHFCVLIFVLLDGIEKPQNEEDRRDI